MKPRTFMELKAAGYSFSGHGTCKNCDEEIEWWITPNDKKIPFNLTQRDNELAVPHQETCGK